MKKPTRKKRKPDKYDRAIAYLRKHPEEILEVREHPIRHTAGSLFQYADVDSVTVGCLTQVKGGNWDAATPELTDAIRADKNLPGQSSKITVKHLPLFARWQRRIDRELGEEIIMGIKPSDLQPHALARVNAAVALDRINAVVDAENRRRGNETMTQAEVAAAKGKGKGRGNPRQPKPGRGEYKNDWEREYAGILENRRISGDLLSVQYESITLHLYGGLKYTPDFFTMTMGGGIAFYEVKGHWRAADKIRFKLAVTTFPYIRFVVVWKEGGKWKRQDYNV